MVHTQLSPALALSLRRLLHFHRVVDNEVHELVESLLLVSLAPPSFPFAIFSLCPFILHLQDGICVL